MKIPWRIVIVLIVFVVLILGMIMLFRPIHLSIELAERAPLSALAVIKSREPSQITLTIEGRHADNLVIPFSGYAKYHEIPVLGLYADYPNRVTFEITTADGKQYTRDITVKTAKLPSEFPTIEVERFLPQSIAPGFTFLHLGHYDADGNFSSLPSAIDNYGHVRWFYTEEIGHILYRLDNGNLLIQGSHAASKPDNLLLEIDMLGRTIAQRAEIPTGIHHDLTFMPNGNLMVLSSAPNSFEDGVVEVDGKTGEVLRGWDFRAILDQNRPPQPRNLEVADWLHLNGIDSSEVDDTFVISGRDQSAVVKVAVESGSLRWILGNHEYWEHPYTDYLLTPIGKDFQWQWGQHAPMIHPSDPSRILVYDNGNERSYHNPLSPMDNYSRAVEFEVDEEHMTVRQVWQYGEELGSTTFTPFIGDANYLSNGNRLICFGGITRSLSGEPVEIFDFAHTSLNKMKISARIVEVTADTPAQEVMRISIADSDMTSYRGYRIYRAERYPLYHPSVLQ